jgi:hypothetical protein
MNSRLKRALGLGTTALLLAGTSVAMGVGSASAASPATGTQGLPYLGKLKMAATGQTNLKLQFDTFNACPAGANRIRARIDNVPPAGDVNPAHQWTGVVILSSTQNGLSTTGPMSVASTDTLQNTAAANSLVLIPGDYAVTMMCGSGTGGATLIGEFDGVLTVSADAQTYTSPAINAPASTTTTIGVSPSSPQVGATAVTITATVNPSSATGTVDFFDGATKLNGASVPVSGGTAAFTTAPLAVGGHSLTARFTSDDVDATTGSVSAATSYQINAPATATTTALGVNPASGATTVDDVTLTATVTPSSAVGHVDFYDNNPATPALLGTVTLNGGTASFTPSPKLAVGTYKFQAFFVPTNPANFQPSQSAELAPYAVTTFNGVSASETLQAIVDAGTLTITAGGPTVDLGHLALNSTNDLLVSAPTDLNPVTVTDTRAGNIHWTASGQVSDFTSASNAKINGANLGWSPRVLDQQAAQTVTAGPVVAPGAGLAVGASAPAGIGLSSARELAHTIDGRSTGTAHLNATVVLQAPTSTVAGTYPATLTLTAI